MRIHQKLGKSFYCHLRKSRLSATQFQHSIFQESHTNCSNKNAIRREVTVKPFWKLHAKLHNVDFHVDTNLSEKLTISYGGETDKRLHIADDEANKSVNIDFDGDKLEALHISVPLRVDINVSAEGCGTATVSNIENNDLKIIAENHNVRLQNIKSNTINIDTGKGNISCSKSIRGDVEMKSGGGNIITEKIQGNTISISTDAGSISAGDLYAEELSLIATDGSIRITSVHGDCELQTRGDITVGTADGKFNALSEEGNIQVYLTDKIKYADIVTNTGNIALALSNGLGGQLDVEAQQVQDCAALSSLQNIHKQQQGPSTRYRAEVNDGGPRISVKALGGGVELKTSSWLDAVSLFNKTE